MWISLVWCGSFRFGVFEFGLTRLSLLWCSSFLFGLKDDLNENTTVVWKTTQFFYTLMGDDLDENNNIETLYNESSALA